MHNSHLPKSDVILIVDDDTRIRKILRIALEAKGYFTLEAASKKEAIELIALQSPKLVLLDLQLPDGSGEDLIKEVRQWTEIPVIVLSVINQDEDKIRLLDSGADDYVTKPFSMGELLARMRTALRRIPEDESQSPWHHGNLKIDITNRQILKNNNVVRLTPTEFQLLAFFIKNSGRVLTYEMLIKVIWGDDAQNEMNSLRVHVAQLRKKIEDHPGEPQWLFTEPGIGYRWK
ncbi:DNA-binding response regulator [Leptospira kobayashii]|uniref:DNA-binding response regulator n=1 Tax=Leptospira kobayashii TaxID=1917830 RepID=A0ABM7UIG5_9LEPT|nr:response regulator transcription factor [Leptospira kobayashii]BDA78498.1 DNA-binding response regulator [Leptospira kobayashii]